MVASPNRRAFDDAIAAWNAGALPRYLELYDPDIRLHGYGPEPLSKDQVSAMYAGMFESLEGIHLDVGDVVEEGDRLCARATLTGVHRGELFGVAGTGNLITQEVITILRFRGGRCVERWSVADTLGVLLQIGAVTLPAS